MMVGFYFPALFQSPVNPWSTVGTLLAVMGTTLVKDWVEDFKRKLADKKSNMKMCHVLDQHGEVMDTASKDIRVGDIVCVRNKEQIPCDLVLLQSSSAESCFVETSNIDGETNMKIREVPGPLQGNKDVLELTGSFECDAPNKNIRSFTGTLLVEGDIVVPCEASNFILRGAQLENTDFIFGLCVYTGRETKIMLNMRKVCNLVDVIASFLQNTSVYKQD